MFKKDSTLVLIILLAILLSIYFIPKMKTNSPAPHAQNVRQEAITPMPKKESSEKIIHNEQDSQADRCKNGYSDGCDKERALSEFMKATGH